MRIPRLIFISLFLFLSIGKVGSSQNIGFSDFPGSDSISSTAFRFPLNGIPVMGCFADSGAPEQPCRGFFYQDKQELAPDVLTNKSTPICAFLVSSGITGKLITKEVDLRPLIEPQSLGMRVLRPLPSEGENERPVVQAVFIANDGLERIRVDCYGTTDSIDMYLGSPAEAFRSALESAAPNFYQVIPID